MRSPLLPMDIGLYLEVRPKKPAFPGTPFAGLTRFQFLKGAVMSDDLNNRGPQDRARVNVNEAHELKYWTRELGVTEDKLRQAVKEVGVSVDALRKHFSSPPR